MKHARLFVFIFLANLFFFNCSFRLCCAVLCSHWLPSALSSNVFQERRFLEQKSKIIDTEQNNLVTPFYCSLPCGVCFFCGLWLSFHHMFSAFRPSLSLRVSLRFSIVYEAFFFFFRFASVVVPFCVMTSFSPLLWSRFLHLFSPFFFDGRSCENHHAGSKNCKPRHNRFWKH